MPKVNKTVKPALVFRGKGHVEKIEKEQYDKGVDVYFQSCAWMNEEVNMKWVRETLVPAIGNEQDEKVIFTDNVGFQQSKTFHQECRNEINISVYMLPENHTDKVQPIDAGCGKMMKTKIAAEMEKSLEEDQNLEKWHDKISAKERRVLMTKWTAAAWKELCQYKNFFGRLFEKTGCLIIVDGSEDHKISPQGLENYRVHLGSLVNSQVKLIHKMYYTRTGQTASTVQTISLLKQYVSFIIKKVYIFFHSCEKHFLLFIRIS